MQKPRHLGRHPARQRAITSALDKHAGGYRDGRRVDPEDRRVFGCDGRQDHPQPPNRISGQRSCAPRAPLAQQAHVPGQRGAERNQLQCWKRALVTDTRLRQQRLDVRNIADAIGMGTCAALPGTRWSRARTHPYRRPNYFCERPSTSRQTFGPGCCARVSAQGGPCSSRSCRCRTANALQMPGNTHAQNTAKFALKSFRISTARTQ